LAVEKYKAIIDNNVIVLKYDNRKKSLTVGGNTKFRRIMVSVLEEYFQVKRIPRVRYIKQNKIKFVSSVGIDEFDEGIENLKDDNFSVEQIERLGDLLR